MCRSTVHSALRARAHGHAPHHAAATRRRGSFRLIRLPFDPTVTRYAATLRDAGPRAVDSRLQLSWP